MGQKRVRWIDLDKVMLDLARPPRPTCWPRRRRFCLFIKFFPLFAFEHFDWENRGKQDFDKNQNFLISKFHGKSIPITNLSFSFRHLSRAFSIHRRPSFRCCCSTHHPLPPSRLGERSLSLPLPLVSYEY